MNKINKLKAFTLLELMVSIFITFVVIVSFYKLYNMSVRSERSTAIRASVNLLGEQMADSIADSIRLTGLNSEKGDLTNEDSTSGIIRSFLGGSGSGSVNFIYTSPFGGPITKLAENASGTYPTCTFTIFNSAALHSNIKSVYLHTQYGIFVSTNTNTAYPLTYNDYSVTFSVPGFSRSPKSDLDGTECKKIFPAGTLLSGEDSVFTLEYSNAAGGGSNSLKLTAKDKNETNATTYIDFRYDSSKETQSYQMPHFVFQFLREYEVSGSEVRSWVNSVDYANRSEVTAVRFGFVMLSDKERAGSGSMTNDSEKVKYCVFDEDECFELKDFNKTAYVFRRVVYLTNYRLLKDLL